MVEAALLFSPMPLLPDDFVPAPGLWDGHAQSLFGVLMRPKLTRPLRRERRVTPDEDFVDLDFVQGRAGAPTVVLLHGLEGSSASGYMQLMLGEVAARGWHGVALNARSCSGEPNLKPQSYSSGDYRDLAWLVQQLEGPLFVVGFSLGASVLLNFLAQHPAAQKVSAAAAVSAPYELARGAAFLDSGAFIARQYLKRFLPTMKAKALAKAKQHPEHFDVAAIKACTRLRDFDHLVTARHFGFASAEDYYARCSAAPQLGRIATRTLLVSAADDALAPPLIPDSAKRQENLDVLVTRAGGHVGFVGGSVLKPAFWVERRVMQWLDGQ